MSTASDCPLIMPALPVDRKTRALTMCSGCICVSIQITWHRFILCPAGNTNAHSKICRLFRANCYLYCPIPGISSLLFYLSDVIFHHDIAGAAGEQVDIQVVIFLSIYIPGNRRYETDHITRTAGAAEPGTALMLALRGKGVGIEEAVPFQ